MKIDFKIFNASKILKDHLDEDVIDEDSISYDIEYMGGAFFEACVPGGSIGFGASTGLTKIVYASIDTSNGNQLLNKFEIKNRIGYPLVNEDEEKKLDEKNTIVYESSNAFQIRIQFDETVESIIIINTALMGVNSGVKLKKYSNELACDDRDLIKLLGKWECSESETLARNSKTLNKAAEYLNLDFVITFEERRCASFFFPHLMINGLIQEYTFNVHKDKKYLKVILMSKGRHDTKEMILNFLDENKFERITEIEFKKAGKKIKENYIEIWNRIELKSE